MLEGAEIEAVVLRSCPGGYYSHMTTSRTSNRTTVPPAQEKVLISRSGNRCAYPKCGIELVIPADHSEDRPKAVGKVAHIAAASPGGPRFDPHMTEAQRGSAENLIYVCGSHHDAIDSQLNEHSRDFLLTAKAHHEQTVSRAMRQAMGSVTYSQLRLICQVVGTGAAASLESIELALPLQQKININNLSEGTADRIRDGLSQAFRVASFVSFQSQFDPGFGRFLVAGVKADYYAAIADGLTPNQVFDYLVETASENAGPRDSPELRAAALAVIAYLFELCEIFERG